MRKIEIKGEGEIRALFVAAFVAAFVLLVFFFFLSDTGKDILKRIDIIPTFNDSKPPLDEIQLIRYNIAKDSIEFSSDGMNFYPFDREIQEIGSIRIRKSTTLTEINAYYLKASLRDPKKIDLSDSGLRNEIYSRQDYENYQDESNKLPPSPNLKIFAVQRGDIVITHVVNGVDEQDTKIYGEVAYDSAGGMQKRIASYDSLNLNQQSLPLRNPKKISEESDLYRTIAPQIAEWRDSILQKPLKFSELGKGFCPRKSNQYLVIDLSKPTSQEECII